MTNKKNNKEKKIYSDLDNLKNEVKDLKKKKDKLKFETFLITDKNTRSNEIRSNEITKLDVEVKVNNNIEKKQKSDQIYLNNNLKICGGTKIRDYWDYWYY